MARLRLPKTQRGLPRERGEIQTFNLLPSGALRSGEKGGGTSREEGRNWRIGENFVGRRLGENMLFLVEEEGEA